MIEDFCGGNLDFKGSDYFEDTINSIDDSTGKWTSKYMCTSSTCPCPTNMDLSLWTENDLQNWNRTKSAINAAANSSLTIIYTALPTETSYSSFYDCYKHILDLKETSSSSAYDQVEELSDDFVSIVHNI
jgi:hypothetical protein